MLSIISIGITKCTDKKLADIPCAGKDAQDVYSAFEKIMGSDFSSLTSNCFIDISSQGFCSLLRNKLWNYSADSANNDVLVLYFSGHARIKRATQALELCFSDADDILGAIDINTIYEATKDSEKNVLLILDCCYSGAALSLASSSVDNSRYAILAACGEMDSSTYDSSGSKFTKVLCEAIYELKSTGGDFSLNSLSQKIVELGYEDATINFGASSANDVSFILKPKSNFLRKYSDFVPRFIARINKSNISLREAMWYSLIDVPEPVIYDICETYFGLNGATRSVSEASWLVRRAIGSVISCLSDTRRKERLIRALLSSCFWQEQCIGLIGVRYLLRDQKEVFAFVVAKVRDSTIARIDAIWLANLYMADSDLYSPEIFFKTPLIQSPWGTIELYKAIQKSSLHNSALLEKFKKEVLPENKSALQEYIALNDEDRSSHGNKLVQQLKKGKTRGRLPEKTESKFLLSSLYGSWRDQINIDLNNYLTSERHSTVVSQLAKAKELSSIDFKMSLISFFQTSATYANRYWREIDWALRDKNLWIRREAIKLYCMLHLEEKSLENCLCEADISNNIYPGLLDLMLELPESICEKLLTKYSDYFVDNDIQSLRHATKLEHATQQKASTKS